MMATLASDAQTPPMSRRRARARASARSHPSSTTDRNPTNSMTDPPLKKRKYVPGGPGGGGRYIEVDGSETPVGGTGPGGYAFSGQRSRPGRDTATSAASPSTTLRRRETTVSMPRFSSAAAAAAAVVQGDGYKPREERGWEEIHPHLDIEAKFVAFSAEEVDGKVNCTSTPDYHQVNGGYDGGLALAGVNGVRAVIAEPSVASPSSATNGDGLVTTDNLANGGDTTTADDAEIMFDVPKKRRVGRPNRRPDPPVNGAITPSAPKIVPPPGPNPREKLTLPKPSFRRIDPFQFFEQKSTGQVRYVDRSMANVGYQESDFFIRPESRLIRFAEGPVKEDLDLVPGLRSDGESNSTVLVGTNVGRVEYDMDEQDDEWLAAHNELRRSQEVEPITREVFEITMTKIEKEWYALEKQIPKPNPKPPQTQRPRSGSAAAVNGEPPGASGEDQDSKCAICDDGDCENTNAIVFCDGCDLAVHQECYGVPFIPEGQWLCRKCQLIGRGTPTCIFCPNTDGAFKQTNASRWSHLLCAIWIPEVSLGNTTFMEPVMDVEKVPKQRWKLTCYICRQKMGACVQCGNKNCFVAFHVTCARRARLFLKMKSAHGGPANIDASVLKAYCDKHVPSDWRRENDVDAATADAQEFYHHTMRGRLWADSQQSALAIVSSQNQTAQAPGEEQNQPAMPRIHLTVGGNKRKANQRAKLVWKLPSGAPVVPQTVYNSVETSLQRFMVRKRKEYVAEACKYWTLKREARRGAALLKRLQLQMETFSSMEVTRRNFAGMGAAGKPRLQRRIDFSAGLLQDLERLQLLCDEVKEREREKLADAEMLKDIVDTVYCPISALLWPIVERAQSLDGKGAFREGFDDLRSKLEARFYTSVAKFSSDFRAVFSSATGLESAAESLTTGEQPDVANTASAATPEQKDLRRLAKRIIKSVQGLLEDAVRKEAELGGKPFEKELRDLEILLDNGMLSRRDSTVASVGEDVGDLNGVENKPPALEVSHPSPTLNGNHSANGHLQNLQDTMAPAASRTEALAALVENGGVSVASTGPKREMQPAGNGDVGVAVQQHEQAAARPENGAGDDHDITSGSVLPRTNGDSQHLVRDGTRPQAGPPTPPLSSTEDLLAPLSYGGIPWYMEPFDPVGTTVHEERWTGREVVRGMSEELSELDDEELQGLVNGDMAAEEPPEPTESLRLIPPTRRRVGKGGSRTSRRRR